MKFKTGQIVTCLWLAIFLYFPCSFARDLPPGLKIFYDEILDDPPGNGQNLTLIREAMAADWGQRPNPLNPAGGTGPFQEGLKQIMGIWGSIMPDVFVNRQQTLLTCQSTNNGLSNKNMIVVQSQFGGNITGVPEGLNEIPFFPGIQPDRILGQQFVSMAMDIQVMDDQNQKHKRTYHLEAWNEALTQLLTGSEPPSIVNPEIPPGEILTEVPAAIHNWYELILSDPLGNGQDDALIAETFAEDWNSRPNALNPIEGTGPFREGVKILMAGYGLLIPVLKFQRVHTMLCGDTVGVLSHVTGTMANELPAGYTEFPMFPGNDPEKLYGKKFETISLDIHVIRDGLIKNSWHIEDWVSAAAQMVNGEPIQDFGLAPEYLYF